MSRYALVSCLATIAVVAQPLLTQAAPRGSRPSTGAAPAPMSSALRAALARPDLPGNVGSARTAQVARATASVDQLPLSFEPNRGQTDPRVAYIAHGGGYTLFLTGDGATLALEQPVSQTALPKRSQVKATASARLGMLPRAARTSQVRESIMRLTFVGANPHPQIGGIGRLPGIANYFIGRDPKHWHTNVPTYARVGYRSVYPNIDLAFYGQKGHIEYDWVVAPGANPGTIRMAVQGGPGLRLDRGGNLLLGSHGMLLQQARPLIYQVVDGHRRAITGRYVLLGHDQVGFAVGSHDRRLPLVIDPVLVYSTYLGRSYEDEGNGIVVDSAGDAYVVSGTYGAFPITAGSYQPSFGGTYDAVVTKLSASGSLLYSTYLGGSNDDEGNGIAVDSAGNAYITGETSGGFPITAGAFQTAFGGGTCSYPNLAPCRDAFVSKLSASGSALLYSTYLGGSADDLADGVAVDSAGSAYVTGFAKSTNFPTTPGAYRTTSLGQEIFVSKLNATGSALLYSTFLGGGDWGSGIAVDSAGNAYVTGEAAAGFSTTAGAYQTTFGGVWDAFVSKLNSSGSALIYSTYLGGSSGDSGNGIAVASDGDAYVTGVTDGGFPVTVGAYQTSFGGSIDVFVSALNASGSALVYSTYLGGSSDDEGYGITLDGAGDAYVAGYTNSLTFPTTASAYQPVNGGGYDAFMSKLNARGSALLYSTYLGGSLYDAANGIALDSAGYAYITGETAGNFPITLGAPQTFYGGGTRSAFVSKILPLSGPSTAETMDAGSPSELGTSCAVTTVPVNCATGNFWHTADLAIPGRGMALHFARSYNSLLANQNGPLGYGWTDNYNMYLTTDSTGAVAVHEEGGSAVTFSSLNSQYLAPSRLLATLARNSDGTFTFKRNKSQEQFIFNAPTTKAAGQLLREVDRNGYATTLTYNRGTLTTVTDPESRTLALAYNKAGQLSTVTDTAGRKVSFQYDSSGNLADVIDEAGGDSHYTYDGNHLQLTTRDPNGGTVTNVYDSSGRVVQQTDAMHRVTTFSYVANADGSQTTTITDPTGNSTVEQFLQNELLSLTRGSGTPQQATWSYDYDPGVLGIIKVTDPNGHVWTNTWDSLGNLLSQQDPLGHTTTSTYDLMNDLTSRQDPARALTTLTYDANGNLTGVAQPLSATTSFTYDPAHPGDVISRTDPNGHKWIYSYDTYGDLAGVTDPLGGKTTMSYDGVGRLTSRVSPNGNVAGAAPSAYTTGYTTNAFGDVTRITDPLLAGQATPGTTTYTYDANRNLKGAQDPNGNTISYAYDADNEQTGVTLPLPTATPGATPVHDSTSYDGDGNVLSHTDFDGHTVGYGYDPLNRTVAITQTVTQPAPVGQQTRVTAYQYDGAGNRTQMTDPRNIVTAYGYDAANRQTSTTLTGGYVESTGYDADGNVTSVTDADTHTTTYGYDTLNRLLTVTDPLNHQVAYQYDPAGNRTQMADQLGHITTYAYDATNRHTGTTYPGNVTEASGYDADGNVTSFTDGRTYTTQYRYDALDRQTQETDARNKVTTYSYDAAGNRTAVQQPLFPATTYQYDQLNRLVSVKDPVNPATTYSYDALGNRTGVQDGNGHLTRYSYDDANELVTVTEPTGATVGAGYDWDGNVVARADELGHQTVYGYDALNHLRSSTDPLNRATGYVYDPVGNLTSLTDATQPAGRTTSYSYDAANELQQVGYSDGVTPGVGFTYLPTGQRATMSDGTGTSAYGYDNRNRLTSATSGAGQAVGYGYDADSDLTALTYPGSLPVIRTYDALDRLSGVTDWLGHTTTFAYDDNSNLQKIGYPTANGAAAAFSYDNANGLTGIVDSAVVSGTGTPFWTYSYGLDGNQQVKTAADPVQGGAQHTYARTPLDQLQSDQVAGGTTTGWSYDAAYQLRTRTDGAAGSSSSFGPPDAAGQLPSVVTTAGGATTQNLALGYDAEGDRTGQADSVGGGSLTYSYDQALRLTGITGSVTASYSYDGDGLRQGSAVGASAPISFTYDLAEGLPLIVQAGGTRYISGPGGLPIEQVDGSGNVRYYLADRQGSTRGLLDPSGAVADTYSYDPYGKQTVVTGSAADTPFGYAGQYTDAETGLQYLRARYYDPATAQFLTRDPMLGATGRPYAYAGDDPLTSGDPSGQCPWCVGALVGGAIGGLGYVAGGALTGQPLSWRGAAASIVGGAIVGGSFGAAGAAGLLGAGWLSASGVAGGAGVGAASGAAASEASSLIGTGQLASGRQLAGAAVGGAITGGFGALGGGLGAGVENAAAGRAIAGGIGAAGGVAGQGAADLIDPADSTGLGGLLEAGALGGLGGALAHGGGGCSCFPGGTGVDTPQGKRAIASLKVGDRVLAEDPGTHKVEAEPVLRVIDDGVKPLLRLDLSDGSSLKVTANHPFYADASAVRTAAGWVHAGDLRIGDHLRAEGGADPVISALRFNQGSAHVYTLTVAHDHTFFVGDGVPVLVHNANGNCVQLGLPGLPDKVLGSTSVSRSLAAAKLGNIFHYDELNGGPLGARYGPSQLSDLFKNTTFRFARRGGSGDDVTLLGGADPWDQSIYPGSQWPAGYRRADFKPNWGEYTEDVASGKIDPNTTLAILYDQSVLRLLPPQNGFRVHPGASPSTTSGGPEQLPLFP